MTVYELIKALAENDPHHEVVIILPGGNEVGVKRVVTTGLYPPLIVIDANVTTDELAEWYGEEA